MNRILQWLDYLSKQRHTSTKSPVPWAVFALQLENLHRFNFYTLIKGIFFMKQIWSLVSAPVEVGRNFSVDLRAVSEEMNVM